MALSACAARHSACAPQHSACAMRLSACAMRVSAYAARLSACAMRHCACATRPGACPMRHCAAPPPHCAARMRRSAGRIRHGGGAKIIPAAASLAGTARDFPPVVFGKNVPARIRRGTHAEAPPLKERGRTHATQWKDRVHFKNERTFNKNEVGLSSRTFFIIAQIGKLRLAAQAVEGHAAPP